MIGLREVLKSRIASRTSCDLPPQRRRAGRPDHDAGDAVVDLRLAQRVDQRADGGRRFEELADDAARLHLLEVAADPQDERRVALDARLTPDEQRGDHQAGHRDGDRRER